MSWLKAKIEGGGGFFLSLLYVKDLWNVGMMYKSDDPTKDLRATAGIMTLYAYEIIAIDGTECADQTAPSHRLDQLIQARGTALAYLKTLAPEIKEKVVDDALDLERRTAPLRQQDALLCSGGMQQMMAGLKGGTQHEVPSQPSQVGKTVGVEPPSGWAPSFLPPDKYQPLQNRSRTGMKSALTNLIK